MAFNQYWIAWIFGMLLPLGFKLGHHLFKTDRTQVKFSRAIAEFIFLDPSAAFKTTLNLSAELVLGAIYIDQLPAPYMPVFEMPQHWAAAFFLALMAELLVPLAVDGIVEWVKKKIKKFAET